MCYKKCQIFNNCKWKFIDVIYLMLNTTTQIMENKRLISVPYFDIFQTFKKYSDNLGCFDDARHTKSTPLHKRDVDDYDAPLTYVNGDMVSDNGCVEINFRYMWQNPIVWYLYQRYTCGLFEYKDTLCSRYKLIRIVMWSPYQVYIKPLLVVSKVLSANI